MFEIYLKVKDDDNDYGTDDDDDGNKVVDGHSQG